MEVFNQDCLGKQQVTRKVFNQDHLGRRQRTKKVFNQDSLGSDKELQKCSIWTIQVGGKEERNCVEIFELRKL